MSTKVFSVYEIAKPVSVLITSTCADHKPLRCFILVYFILTSEYSLEKQFIMLNAGLKLRSPDRYSAQRNLK
jgi:hypothetical protein